MDVNEIIKEYEKLKKLNLYEIFCNFSYNIFKIPLSEEEKEKFIETNKFCNLRIPAASNISASIIFFIFSFILLFFLSFFLSAPVLFFLFILLSFLTFLIYYYPFLLSKLIRSSASAEIMHAIIYMCISLRQTPNLERAIFFTARNLHGYVGSDFKRVAGKILLGETTTKEGLMEIIEKWYKEAKEFSEALKILISYSENPRTELLEEAIRIVHEETFLKLEKYSRNLKLPSMIILGLGIILPLLTLTILPLFSIFFPAILSLTSLIIIYNLLLPTLLFILILTISTSRPLTTSYLLIENPFEIKIGNVKVNLILLLIVISSLLFFSPFLDFLKNSKNYELCAFWASTKFSETKKPKELELSREECKNLLISTSYFDAILPLILFILPFSILLIKLRSILNKRERVEKLEKEFSSIMYQIGYYLKMGNTLEISILKGIERFKKFEVRRFFEKIISNLRIYGSLEEAIFGKTGAIKEYPSSLIKGFFEVVVEVYKKGYIFAGEAMIRLSNYLSSLHKLQEKIEETLSEVISNLKFISTFLTPLITAAAIALAIILISILNVVAMKMIETGTTQEVSIPFISLPFFSITNVSGLYSGSLIFAMGIYILEIVSISSFFIVSLEKGYEKNYLISYIIKSCLLSIIIYTLVIFFASLLIMPLISIFFSFSLV